MIPTVNIKIASMELVPIVIYHCLRLPSKWDDLDLSHFPAEEELVQEARSIALNAVRREIDVEQPRDEKAGMLVFAADFEGRFPGNVTPSFATSNVILWYRLKVKVVADVCGKDVEHEAETRVVVLADVKA